MQKAFTLAEVLITLGVIGVVSAVTIPTLIQNHRKQIVETKLQKYYSTINQAIQLSENENGPKEYWLAMGTDLEPIEWFDKYLNKYIKTIKKEVKNNTLVLYFPDGSVCKDWSFYPDAKDYTYCENLTDNRECMGKKLFTFLFRPNSTKATAKYHVNKGVEPFKFNWDGRITTLTGETVSTVDSDSVKYTCSKELPINGRAYCTALIQANGWKIPKDYPIKF